jgi:hypothetical protein
VGDGVGVGVGVGVREWVGVGDGDAEGDEEADEEADADGDEEAECDGLGLADLVGEAVTVGVSGGARSAGAGRRAGWCDRDVRGPARRDGSLLAAAGVLAAAVPPRAWAARARTPCSPVTVMSVALSAATIHSTTAAAAVAAPGLARILLHPRNVPARRKPVTSRVPACPIS